jgi:hypothetical protein
VLGSNPASRLTGHNHCAGVLDFFARVRGGLGEKTGIARFMKESSIGHRIAAEGSFSGQVIGGMIYGRVQGSHIEGRIDGSACLYTFTGDRI